MKNDSRFKAWRQTGLSLIELMISITLGLLLLAGVINLFIGSRQSYQTQETLARLQEAGRFSMDFIVQDLRRAGYWGGNADVSSLGEVPNATCAGVAWGKMIRQRVFGIDGSANGYACVTSHLTGDVLVARYAETFEETPSGSRLYLRSSLFEAQVMQGDAVSTIADEPQWVRPLAARAYYIRESGRTCGAQAIPSLWLVQLNPNNGTPDDPIELVPGVESLQVQWGVDSTGDGSVDSYMNAAETMDWQQVVAARVWILVRSACPEQGHTDERTYRMGNASLTPNDSFRRQLYVSTVMLRNTATRNAP